MRPDHLTMKKGPVEFGGDFGVRSAGRETPEDLGARPLFRSRLQEMMFPGRR